MHGACDGGFHVLFAWSGLIGSSRWSRIVARHRAILVLPFEIHFE